MASEGNSHFCEDKEDRIQSSPLACRSTSGPSVMSLAAAVAGGMGKGESNPRCCRFYAAGFCAAGPSCPFLHLEKLSIPQATVGEEEGRSTPLMGDSLVRGVTSSITSLSLDEEKVDPPFGVLSFAQLASVGLPAKARQQHAPASLTTTNNVLAPPSEVVTGNKTFTTAPSTKPHVPVCSIYVSTKSNDLCHFAMVGKCRYGDLCKNVHGLQCPRCLRYCLHPHDVGKNEEHIEECLGKEHILSPNEISNIECGICLAKIAHKDDPRFGLMNCDHAFCLHCIRTWRSQHSMSDLATKSCPLCRTVTFFVIPSSTWTIEPHEKLKIVEAYKRKVGEIDCKYFNYGNGECPFSHSCFYAHRTRTGLHEARKSVVRAYTGKDEKLRAVRETRLSDFIDFRMEKPARSKK